jgi:hypothetical protein
MRREIAGILSALVLVVSLVLVMTPLTTVGAATYNEEFSESDTFVVPAGVTKITVEAWGSGGAGGGSTNAGWFSARGGAGGGGGAYASSTLTVEPGQELQVVIGAGGTGVSGTSGNAGSPSFVGPNTDPDNALVRAAGGSGGTGNTAGGSPPGGTGGAVEDSIGQNRIAGGNGGNGATGFLFGTSSGAGGDSAYGGGSGGAALSSGTANGNPGDVPGGGGGGARTAWNQGARAGGAGAAGKVMITWVTYDLTTSSTAGGNVTTPGEGTFTYGEEAVVNLVATPDEGYRFDQWTGNVSTIADVYAAATNITMNDDYSITANFAKISYDLTTGSTAGGSVTTPGEGTYPYDCGTVVDLVAEADACYEFVNWTGDVGTIADVNDATTTIAMNDNYSITANFAKISYDLTTGSTAGGSVTTPGEGTYPYDCGTVVDLVATPDAGYRFDQWTGDVSTIADVNDATTTITMNGDYSITANFVAIYDLTMMADPEVGGTATDLTDESPYAEGTEVNIKAEANEGYGFVNWTAPAGVFGNATAEETTFTMPAQNVTVTANFEEVSPPPVYPTVTTQAATDITTNSATLNMNYTMGNLSQVEVRFAYKKSTDLAWSYTAWVSKTEDGTHAESLTGLDSDTEYTFTAQLRGSASVEGTTIQFTTDKSSTPPPSGGGVSACFIATAAYGTPTAEQIDVLREFRDVVLLESTVGAQFVALYYQLSPPVADFISESSFLRTLVREFLVDPIVWVVEATGDIWRN